MTVLHIANDYGGSSVHAQLYSHLDKIGLKQIIYVPLNYKNRNRFNSKPINFQVEGSFIIYSSILKRRHRYLYSQKIRILLNDIVNRLNNYMDTVTVIHATTWCLDGAIAYELHKKYNLPYLIAIRNTDLNIYYKYMFWYRKYFYDILAFSSRVIFISNQYKYHLFNSLLKLSKAKDLYHKTELIPNGIDSFFLNNRSYKKDIQSPIKLLYIGSIEKNKNIHTVLLAIKKLREKGVNLTYTAIGKGLRNNGNEKYLSYIENAFEEYDWFSILNYQTKEELYKSFKMYDIFLMASFRETFGLSYLEAISQGLPVIYSAGQGFDGLFEEGVVGFHVNPSDSKDIENKLFSLISSYKKITSSIQNLSLEIFKWDNIACKYKKIYSDLIK